MERCERDDEAVMKHLEGTGCPLFCLLFFNRVKNGPVLPPQSGCCSVVVWLSSSCVRLSSGCHPVVVQLSSGRCVQLSGSE